MTQVRQPSGSAGLYVTLLNALVDLKMNHSFKVQGATLRLRRVFANRVPEASAALEAWFTRLK